MKTCISGTCRTGIKKFSCSFALLFLTLCHYQNQVLHRLDLIPLCGSEVKTEDKSCISFLGIWRTKSPEWGSLVSYHLRKAPSLLPSYSCRRNLTLYVDWGAPFSPIGIGGCTSLACKNSFLSLHKLWSETVSLKGFLSHMALIIDCVYFHQQGRTHLLIKVHDSPDASEKFSSSESVAVFLGNWLTWL